MLAARVYGDAGPGPLFDHLTLRVDVDEAPWLVDVGFGRFVAAPFRLDVRDDQHDLAGVVRVVETDEGDLDVRLGDRPELRVERRPRTLDDFGPTCWYQQTSPDSHFTQSLTCSRPTGDHDRVTISDRLLITTVAGQRTETTLGSDADVLAAYREHFGFTLDRLPTPPVP
jgi:N-hydroxyarylamine O-acetyltransferase